MLGILHWESRGFEGNPGGKKNDLAPLSDQSAEHQRGGSRTRCAGIPPFDVSSSVGAETMIIKLTYYKAALILASFVVVRVSREG